VRRSDEDDDRPSARASSGGSSPSTVSVGLPSGGAGRPSATPEVKPAAASNELTSRDRDFKAFCDYVHKNYPSRAAPNEAAHAGWLMPKLRKLANLRAGERVTLAPEHKEFLVEVQNDAARLYHGAKAIITTERGSHDRMPSPVTEVQRKFKTMVFDVVTHEGVGEIYRLDDVHRRDWGNAGTGKGTIDGDADVLPKVQAAMQQIYKPKYEHPLSTECKLQRAPDK